MTLFAGNDTRSLKIKTPTGLTKIRVYITYTRRITTLKFANKLPAIYIYIYKKKINDILSARIN